MKTIEKKIKLFFDYNRFIQDNEFEDLLKNSGSTQIEELDDNQADLVAAAGIPTNPHQFTNYNSIESIIKPK